MSNALRPLLILSLMVLLNSGCATVSSKTFTAVMTDSSVGPAELSERLQKPPVDGHVVSPSVQYQVYIVGSWLGANRVAVYFKDGKIVEQGPDTPEFHLNIIYKLGVITQEEYRWRYEQLKKEEYRQQQLALQQQALAQQKEFQEKKLEIEKAKQTKDNTN